ncbi:MAG TPA: allantoicase [Thermoanaerobaculia bacterium]|nr:allantoicase [Thermoanaerobaculia bacterium]
MTEFRDYLDLAAERVGGTVLYATDDYFADKENLLKPGKAVWREHEYTDRGKWMDGWEGRRKRVPGHDYAIVRLGLRGVIRGVVVDTSFFRGNYPDRCSIEACDERAETDVATLEASARWVEILAESPLQGDSENLFTIDSPFAFTHLRLRIFPDGGVARLRVHGEPVPDWRRIGGLANEVDLAAVENGGDVLACSDMFFGPKHNLIMPGRAVNMSDGWETRRRRGPGHDWVIVQLATEGLIQRIEIDTNHFKGNFPDSCSVEATLSADISSPATAWGEILPRTALQAHTRHVFADELEQRGAVSHLRLNVFPDGGVSRLRAHGRATQEGSRTEVVRRINTTLDVERDLHACCGSAAWVKSMKESRPFANWEALVEAADQIWEELDRDDWLEAFHAHPRIGDKAAAQHGSGASRWSEREQAAISSSLEGDRSRLAEANLEYEKRFGHIFIVCATGRSLDEMSEILENRLNLTPEEEIVEAAEEQRKITRLRLEKLVLR